ncbi:S-layer homology domain-containing protein [Paenibacillus sp. HWE-109]|uniref:S-layer homology domain-containing protein n=1 Tax=Paenibacillus sp. HWE-109 TaxID=1306526 RepID=UPI001EE0D5FF|nr:S-layer homology domain-containing protein [Paenibacillus sp. HWE-109]UKS27026.1 S-layer homology domain-containing protein [Paenibacillus sp. HWE-109]
MNWIKKQISMVLLLSLTVSSFGLSAGPAAAASAVGMDENFNSLQPGTFSAANWTPTLTPDGSIQVVTDSADPTNQSVRLEKTTTTATSNLTLDRKNLSITGKAIVSYRFKSDETSGTKSAPYIYGAGTSNNIISLSLSGANITAYNGGTSSSIQSGFQAGQWYHIQFVLDTATKKYDAYMDGVKKAAGFSFRDTTANTDTLKLIRFSIDKAQKGTIQFDDLFVDQLPDTIGMEPAYHLSVSAAHNSQVTAAFSDHTLDVTDKVYYSSSNPAVASVNKRGVVTGLSTGTAVITSSLGDLTAATTVTVSSASVLNAVQLDQADYQLNEGQQQLSVLTAVYSSGPVQVNGMPGVSFVSSNPTVASVDASSGLLRALHYGTSVLTATYGDKSTTATVTIAPVLQELLSVSPGAAGMELAVGGTAGSITKAVYSDGQSFDISSMASYYSDQPSVAAADQLGNVHAIAPGQAVITVTYSTKSVSYPVRVSSIQLDSRAYTLANGAAHSTKVSLIGPGGQSVDVTGQSTFRAADPSIIQVDASGKVTALRSGTTSVIVSYGASEAKAIVTVLGEVASSEFTLQTAASDATISVRISAGGNALHGAVGPIHSAQAEFDYNPAELQFVGATPVMFAGNGTSLAVTDSVYQIAGQPTGYQSVITPENGRVLYAATVIGDGNETHSVGAGSSRGIATLVFRVQHPGSTVSLGVNKMSLGMLSNDTVVQTSPSQLDAQIKLETIAPVWSENSKVTVDQVSVNSLKLTWIGATDNVGVTGYRIYNGSHLAAAVAAPASTLTVANLQASTTYTFRVQAGDAAGNWTNDGPFVTVQTASESGSSEPSPSTPVPSAPAPTPTPSPSEKPKIEVQPDPVTPAKPVEPKPFKDVTANFAWASKAIETLTAKGIIQGTSNTTFDPSKEVTRADAVTLLVRALNLKADFHENFNDVSEKDYYYQALGIAKELGILSGTGNNDAIPGQAITRQDLFVLFVRALNASGKLNIQVNESVLDPYQDRSSIAPYAINSIAAMVQLGIVEGDGAGINPRGTASRAEMAVVLFRLLDKLSILPH